MNDLIGGWIIYKAKDNKMHELVAYELMSANDAPERDPKDWYVFLKSNNKLIHLTHIFWLAYSAETSGRCLRPSFHDRLGRLLLPCTCSQRFLCH